MLSSVPINQQWMDEKREKYIKAMREGFKQILFSWVQEVDERREGEERMEGEEEERI